MSIHDSDLSHHFLLHSACSLMFFQKPSIQDHGRRNVWHIWKIWSNQTDQTVSSNWCISLSTEPQFSVVNYIYWKRSVNLLNSQIIYQLLGVKLFECLRSVAVKFCCNLSYTILVGSPHSMVLRCHPTLPLAECSFVLLSGKMIKLKNLKSFLEKQVRTSSSICHHNSICHCSSVCPSPLFSIRADHTTCNLSNEMIDAVSYTVYTRVQVERVYKSNPIFEF